MLYKLRGIVQMLSLTVATGTGIAPGYLACSEVPLGALRGTRFNWPHQVTCSGRRSGPGQGLDVSNICVSGETLLSPYALFINIPFYQCVETGQGHHGFPGKEQELLTASRRQSFLSSSSRWRSVSSRASCRDFRAASMSFLADWELSDS